METIKQAATEFLAHKRIAVTGVSRNAEGHGANLVFRRLRERGYEVFPVNPHAEQVEGTRAYPDLGSIPGGVSPCASAPRWGSGTSGCIGLLGREASRRRRPPSDEPTVST